MHLFDTIVERGLIVPGVREVAASDAIRLVVPHRYAYKSPKWFRGWEYLTAPQRGFWAERGYHPRGDPWQEERYPYSGLNAP